MPRLSSMLSAAALTFALVATAPAGAAPLRPLHWVTPDGASSANVVKVDYRRHHRGYDRRPRGGVFFHFGFGPPPFEPYYEPPVYSYDPYYYAPRYAPPQYYAPAPYVYEPAPAPYSDSTGRCPQGQQYRYPIGCVPG